MQLVDAETLEVLKSYVADTPLNSAAITPVKDYVILGGGQAYDFYVRAACETYTDFVKCYGRYHYIC
jgi:hypothetical protein